MVAYLLMVFWVTSNGQQMTVTEVGSASGCYDAKAKVEEQMKGAKDLRVLCIKR